MRIETDFGIYDGVFLKTDRYAADNSVYIQAWNWMDGPIATLTVCLDDRMLEKNETYLDTNNCPWVVDFMVNNGLAELTGKMRASGFCVYPSVKLNMAEIGKVG